MKFTWSPALYALCVAGVVFFVVGWAGALGAGIGSFFTFRRLRGTAA